MSSRTPENAYELRNPGLGAAVNSPFLVRNQLGADLDPEVDAHLGRSEHETNRAAALSEDLTAYMRQRPPAISTLDLAGLTREVLESTPLPPGFTRSKPAPGIAEHADKDQFMQVPINLITNACQAMPQGGSLTVAGYEFDSPTEITV